MGLLLIGVWHLFLIRGTNPKGILVRWVVRWDVTDEGTVSKSSGSVCSAIASVGVPELLYWTCFIFWKHLSNQLILQPNGLVLTANDASRRVTKVVEVILPGWEESVLLAPPLPPGSGSIPWPLWAGCMHPCSKTWLSYPPEMILGFHERLDGFSWPVPSSVGVFLSRRRELPYLMSVSWCCVWTTCVFPWSFEYLEGKVVVGTLWS